MGVIKKLVCSISDSNCAKEIEELSKYVLIQLLSFPDLIDNFRKSLSNFNQTHFNLFKLGSFNLWKHYLGRTKNLKQLTNVTIDDKIIYQIKFPDMGFLSCLKNCSCWCIFMVSAVIMLVTLGLALSDMMMVAETEQEIDMVLNAPNTQIRCLQICRTWFSQENGQFCCDRYNSDLCMEKIACREEYFSNSETDLSILKENVESQVLTASFCLIVMVGIALFQYKQHSIEKKVEKKMTKKIEDAIQLALSDKIIRDQEGKEDNEDKEKDNPETAGPTNEKQTQGSNLESLSVLERSFIVEKKEKAIEMNQLLQKIENDNSM